MNSFERNILRVLTSAKECGIIKQDNNRSNMVTSDNGRSNMAISDNNRSYMITQKIGVVKIIFLGGYIWKAKK